uniref:COS41.3 n=1 Tax=Phallusia mammillata TaxID=59560 RepID=A0A6F9DRS8_9ASCI|nr:COS41.3 [Phallusia mammillata]
MTWCQKWFYKMEGSFSLPEAMQWSGNVSQNWVKFIRGFRLYLTAVGYDGKAAKVKTSMLLHVLGEQGQTIHSTFKFEEGQEMHFETVVNAFESYCCPRKNITSERYRFFSRNQNDGERIDVFITDLKKLSKSCDFGELCDSLIRDKIIIGIKCVQLRQSLLREEELTLEKAIKMCITNETVRSQMTMFRSTNSTSFSLDAVQREPRGNQLPAPRVYRFCALRHDVRACPAWGRRCLKCGGRNHFARCCSAANHPQAQRADTIQTYNMQSVVTE